MSKYTTMLGASLSGQGAQRVAGLAAALAPPAAPPAGTAMTAPPPPTSTGSVTDHVMGLLPGLGGGAAGAYLWKKHRVLGFIAGHALVGGGYEFYKGDRKTALCDLAVEGASIGGSLYFKKHPVLGFFGGMVAGAVATAFVPGSRSNDLYHRLKP